MLKPFALIGILILLASCGTEKKEKIDEQLSAVAPTFEIAPPIATADPEAEIFEIDNSKDTILITDYGSFVSVPANCFVDANGNPVTKAVEIAFTEYQNPADIILSGIPMGYIQEEDTMTFQSAGMCKIEAFSEDKTIEMAGNGRIEIGMRNRASDPNYNLYYFDEKKGEWEEEEKDLEVVEATVPAKPITVSMIDSSRVVHLDINYQPNSTFQAWDNSNFYLVPGQKLQYANSGVSWYDVSVIPTSNPDLYVLNLNGTTGFQQYIESVLVQPLVSEASVESEKRSFKSRMRAYVTALKRNKKKIETDLRDGEEILAQFEAEREANRIAELERMAADSLRMLNAEIRRQLGQEVMRSFSIAKMGIYNCDRFYATPVLATRQLSFEHKGEKLLFDQSHLCSVKDNAVLGYGRGHKGDYNVRFASGDYHFVGLKGGELFAAPVSASTPDGNVAMQQITPEQLEMIVMR